MNVVEVSLGDLIDRTLLRVQGIPDRGAAIVLSAALDSDDTSFTLTSNTVNLNPTDVVELDGELMLVTAKTADAVPEYTVSRGYNFTTSVAHTYKVGQVNPEYPRVRLADGIRSAFAQFEALGLPLVLSKTFYGLESFTDSYRQVIEMPAEARQVFSVKIDLYELQRWEFLDDLATTEYSTGKVIRLPRGYSFPDGVRVTYRVPYRWSSWPDKPAETDTIQMIEGTEDLPTLYAIALLMSNREVARSEIDRAEEWNRGEPSRGSSSNAAVNRWWQEFYRALDEARRLDPPMMRRPYIKRPR